MVGELRLDGVTRRFGDQVALDGFDLAIRGGEFIALLGPSGCGKTTALNCLAGLLPLSGGSIWLDDERIDGLPPERRGFGMVFQNYALFPHLSVRRNVAFGLAMHGVAKQEAADKVEQVLDLVGLQPHAEKYPAQLSGGQQQRVALARALVLNPDILLLDEPLSNLDAKIRVQVRGEIRRLQQALGITTVYVTHDQEEALSLSDRIAVMREGRIQQVAEPRALYERPANRFVADFVGTNNFIPGVCKEREAGGILVETSLGLVHGRLADGITAGTPCVLAVRPENVTLGSAGDNVFEGRVVVASYLGNTLRYDVETVPGLVLTVDVHDAWHHRPLAVGQAVHVGFPASAALTLRDD